MTDWYELLPHYLAKWQYGYERQMAAWRMRHVAGMTFPDIGDRFGVGQQRARQMVLRADRWIKEWQGYPTPVSRYFQQPMNGAKVQDHAHLYRVVRGLVKAIEGETTMGPDEVEAEEDAVKMRDGIIEGLHRELLGVRNARDANHDEKMRFENIAANQMEHIRQLKHRVDELTEALRDKPRPPSLASALEALQTALSSWRRTSIAACRW